jgi:hypothetical protein
VVFYVPILSQGRAFEAFDDFSDFVQSINYGTSKTCQEPGSNPFWGATLFGLNQVFPIWERGMGEPRDGTGVAPVCNLDYAWSCAVDR